MLRDLDVHLVVERTAPDSIDRDQIGSGERIRRKGQHERLAGHRRPEPLTLPCRHDGEDSEVKQRQKAEDVKGQVGPFREFCTLRPLLPSDPHKSATGVIRPSSRSHAPPDDLGAEITARQ